MTYDIGYSKDYLRMFSLKKTHVTQEQASEYNDLLARSTFFREAKANREEYLSRKTK